MFLAFTEEGIDDDPVRTEGEMTNDHNKRWLSEKKKRKKKSNENHLENIVSDIRGTWIVTGMSR